MLGGLLAQSQLRLSKERISSPTEPVPCAPVRPLTVPWVKGT